MLIELATLLLLTEEATFCFDFSEEPYIHIEGERENGEWVISARVSSRGNFAWGCNKFHTGIYSASIDVIRRYLTLVLTQMSECEESEGRDKLTLKLKSL